MLMGAGRWQEDVLSLPMLWALTVCPAHGLCECRAARLAARDHEVAELQAELDAARDTIDDLRAQLKRALQLAAR